MSQEVFVTRYRQRWLDLEEMLDRIESKKLDQPMDGFPERYRQVCRHLAVARSRGYSPSVRERLERMVERGHGVLYRHRRDPWEAIWSYAAGGFARDVRANGSFLLAATLVFVVPFVGMLYWVIQDPDVAIDVLGVETIFQMEMMYGDSSDLARESEADWRMFGFYIFNNVGIALRTFGSGIVFGVGSLAILLFNGGFIGAVSGYVTSAGHGGQFWPFVVGHGSFELTAIVLAGMTGLKIGSAPIWPGRRRRGEALRVAARESVGIVLGFSVMLLIAAFIEAFWSPRQVEATIRYAVGAGLWALVLGYFAFAGRGRRGSQ